MVKLLALAQNKYIGDIRNWSLDLAAQVSAFMFLMNSWCACTQLYECMIMISMTPPSAGFSGFFLFDWEVKLHLQHFLHKKSQTNCGRLFSRRDDSDKQRPGWSCWREKAEVSELQLQVTYGSNCVFCWPQDLMPALQLQVPVSRSKLVTLHFLISFLYFLTAEHFFSVSWSWWWKDLFMSPNKQRGRGMFVLSTLSLKLGYGRKTALPQWETIIWYLNSIKAQHTVQGHQRTEPVNTPKTVKLNEAVCLSTHECKMPQNIRPWAASGPSIKSYSISISAKSNTVFLYIAPNHSNSSRCHKLLYIVG